MPKEKRYIVLKPWGDHKTDDVLADSKEVRRKIQEGGTVAELTPELLKKKKDAKAKKNEEFLKMQKPVKNKMEPEPGKNKEAN